MTTETPRVPRAGDPAVPPASLRLPRSGATGARRAALPAVRRPAGPARAATAPLPVRHRAGRAAVTGLPLAPHRTATRRRAWVRQYAATLVVLDAIALQLGAVIGYLTRFARIDGTVEGVQYRTVVLAATAGWVLTLATSGTYDSAVTGLGSEEFRRVGNAAARFTALLAIVVYLFRWDVARGLVVVALPVATVATLALRFAARKVLHRVRATGAASQRVLVVGGGTARDQLAQRLTAHPHCGYQVVGRCSPHDPDGVPGPPLAHVRALAERLDADAVAVAHSPDVSADVLRRLAWSLEGSGIDLLVAPALTDIAGPRINIRPVSGLPLLQIAEPEFTGAGRVVKGAIDAVGSLVLLLLALPALVAVGTAVRASGPGPVLFRQTRIGRDGRPFTILKFRTMHVDAEDRLVTLRDRNDHGDGVLFKLRDDPRITRVGQYLRRWSLDELPQLLNVLCGQMSLVGPRPPLPSEVERYEQHVHRRLLVKPGLTGLWQVSGRSDLDWSETVRLDLYYVENWAVSLDAEILWKTLRAVARGSGAR